MLLGSGWAGRVGVGAHEMAKSELQWNPNNYINATCKAEESNQQTTATRNSLYAHHLTLYIQYLYVRMHIGR